MAVPMPPSVQSIAAELLIETEQLKLGMFVVLDLSWMEHPFPFNRFVITSQTQIDQIQGIGLKRVKVITAQSVIGVFDHADSISANQTTVPDLEDVLGEATIDAPQVDDSNVVLTRQRALDEQQKNLRICELRFRNAMSTWRQVANAAVREPVLAGQQSIALVDGFVNELSSAQEVNIRLLPPMSGDGNALHALNVTVVSLLLGRAMKLGQQTLRDIGLGALLHDVGKLALPDRFHWNSGQFTVAEERTYQEHVGLGLKIASQMALPVGAKLVIAQHHETEEGKGYPKELTGDRLSLPSKVVSLVNAYDNLCRPGASVAPLTPHEALSKMFGQSRSNFNPVCLTAFIRLMGVYPPGSVVQLSDDRIALVVAANASRPLKPTVLVFDESVPRDQALFLDLQTVPSVTVQRNLHSRHLSRAAFNYLSPKTQVSYFFERRSELSDEQALVFDRDSKKQGYQHADRGMS